MDEIDQNLINYIEKNIFPKYKRFYSHGLIHINNVIKNCIMLAEYYNLNKNMCYVMAAYHDIGLSVDRNNHEKESAKIFLNDDYMKNFFNNDEINIIKEAIEDHRGSRKEKPRSFYGCVLSDSDRDFDIHILAKRQNATSIKHYPELKNGLEHFEHCYEYLLQRINNSGHFNLWTSCPILIEQRENFEKDFLNKEFAKAVYIEDYREKEKNGEIDLIKNYYLDY